MCKSRQHTKLKWNEPKLEMSPVLKTKPTSLEMDDRAVFDDSLGSRDSEEHESSSLLSDKTFNGPGIEGSGFWLTFHNEKVSATVESVYIAILLYMYIII